MELGNFSISLAVKDLNASRAFYEAFGFEQLMGEPDKGWIILNNGKAVIGLFQGMFDENIITFNPPDARGIQRAIKAAGYELLEEAADGEGPAHFMVKDPDGNRVLVDQHE